MWNSRHLSTAVDELRAQGVPVKDEDVARLTSARASGAPMSGMLRPCRHR
ncbi:hypothetical protein [Streptosporangium roseum]